MSDTYIVEHKTVADFEGTPFAVEFAQWGDDHLVVAVRDTVTGLCCALAAATDQPADGVEREARYQLALYIAKRARHNEAAGDASDPRA